MNPRHDRSPAETIAALRKDTPSYLTRARNPSELLQLAHIAGGLPPELKQRFERDATLANLGSWILLHEVWNASGQEVRARIVAAIDQWGAPKAAGEFVTAAARHGPFCGRLPARLYDWLVRAGAVLQLMLVVATAAFRGLVANILLGSGPANVTSIRDFAVGIASSLRLGGLDGPAAWHWSPVAMAVVLVAEGWLAARWMNTLGRLPIVVARLNPPPPSPNAFSVAWTLWTVLPHVYLVCTLLPLAASKRPGVTLNAVLVILLLAWRLVAPGFGVRAPAGRVPSNRGTLGQQVVAGTAQ